MAQIPSVMAGLVPAISFSGHDAGRRGGRPARPRTGPVGRLRGAFLGMGGTVDDLEVRRAPEAEEVGPGQVAVLARNLEERDAVVDLGAAQEPPSGRAATTSLQALQEAGLIARRVPELPGRDTGRVPLPAARAAGARNVAMPAEPEHRLSADAAGTRPLGEARVAIRRRRRPEALVLTPAPTRRRAAAAGERSGEAVGAQRVGAPVELDRPRRQLGNPARRERVAQHRLRESLRHRLEEARPRPLVALPEPFRILDLPHATAPADPARRLRRPGKRLVAPCRRQEKGRPSRPLEVWKKLLEAEPGELTLRKAYVYLDCKEQQRIRLSS